MFKKTLIACLLSALAPISVTAFAEPLSDYRVESDRSTSTLVDSDNTYAINDKVFSDTRAYVKNLVDAGYPVASIVLHLVTRGMTVSDVAYYVSSADSELTQQIYLTVADLLPNLPSWVCDDRLSMDYVARPETQGEAGVLQPESIRDIASSYFSSDKKKLLLESGDDDWKYPDWDKGERHLTAPIDELIELARNTAKDGRSAWWYRSSGTEHIPGQQGTPVLVSLFSHDKSIVIDAGLDQLLAAKQQGVTSLPVVIIYNDSKYVPASSLALDGASDPAQGGSHSIEGVVTRFFSSGERLAPVREWHYGDYHFRADASELKALFDLSDPSGIDPAKLQQYAKDPSRPVLITVFYDSRSYWVDDPERVAALIEQGQTHIPVVFFYHQLQRYNCAIPATCLPAVANAIEAATQRTVPFPLGPGIGVFPPISPQPPPIAISPE